MTLLITVIILGIVALATGLSIALRAVGELDMGNAGTQSEQAQAVVDACMGEALIKIGRDATYSGETLTIGQIACTIGVTINGTSRTVTVTALSGRWTRAVQTTAAVTGTGVTLRRWQSIE